MNVFCFIALCSDSECVENTPESTMTQRFRIIYSLRAVWSSIYGVRLHEIDLYHCMTKTFS